MVRGTFSSEVRGLDIRSIRLQVGESLHHTGLILCVVVGFSPSCIVAGGLLSSSVVGTGFVFVHLVLGLVLPELLHRVWSLAFLASGECGQRNKRQLYECVRCQTCTAHNERNMHRDLIDSPRRQFGYQSTPEQNPATPVRTSCVTSPASTRVGAEIIDSLSCAYLLSCEVAWPLGVRHHLSLR